MVTLYAEFTVLPGHEQEVADLMAGLTRDVRAEPGNVTFEAHVERDRPNRYFVYEVYRDEQAFADHINAGYGAVFNERLNQLIEEDGSQLTFLSRPGAS
ncbi:quinol monooxygenase YgiN [Kineosphaera limosa]|uniref:ABM domain-containing protein n=1 Tax=Kineosphaera limosa NBRC 100340 TaxID=1184609 RepID=K6WQ13_9MICO|nr:putative quinol monooxygenase [Kineosphaera limosa]NYE01307.1 quinol monooxygenase YgiN [Kineosphaera limosa]GAB95896.1 hypothetical protein KILIM_029_00050 [Kineosphaera limosa NBRC 100340]